MLRSGNESVKTCGRCKLNLDIDDFGLNRNRGDGRSRYCKQCNRDITNAHRVTKRAYKARAGGAVERKKTVTAEERRAQKVERAINEGCRQWEALMKKTRLSDDLLGVTLVGLIFDKRSIRPRTINGQRFYVSAA